MPRRVAHPESIIATDWVAEHQNDPIQRVLHSKEQTQWLLVESGIVLSTSVVLYGDNNNWFATYGFWQMKLYGHRRVKLMIGDRQKRIAVSHLGARLRVDSEQSQQWTPARPWITAVSTIIRP